MPIPAGPGSSLALPKGVAVKCVDHSPRGEAALLDYGS